MKKIMIDSNLGHNNLSSRDYNDLVKLRDECLLYQAFISIGVYIEELEGLIENQEDYENNGFDQIIENIVNSTIYLINSLLQSDLDEDSDLGKKIELLKTYIVSLFKRLLTSDYENKFVISLGSNRLHDKVQELLGQGVLQDPTDLLNEESPFFDDRVLDEPGAFGDKVFRRNEDYNPSVTVVGVEYNISDDLLYDHGLLEEGGNSILSELDALIAKKKRDMVEGDAASAIVDATQYSTLADVIRLIEEGEVSVGGSKIVLSPEELQKFQALIAQTND